MRSNSLLVGFLLASGALAQAHLRYIENKGQWPDPVTFRAEARGATIWVERGAVLVDRYDEEAVARLHGAHAGHADGDASPVIRHHAVRLTFIGSTGPERTEREGASNDYFNYFIGSDHSRWASKCHSFAHITMRDLYPGVDLVIHAQGQALKYDLVIAPNVDPSTIAFTYDGADELTLRDGKLIVKTSLGELTEEIPLAYLRREDGDRMPVPCDYVLEGRTVRIKPRISGGATLVIDPTLSFSSYSGSTANNFGYTATYDNDGFLFSGSSAFGQGYPTTLGAYQTIHAGGDGSFNGIDIALTKYDTTGTFLRWSTFLGGASDELPHSLITNNADELFVFGTTSSLDFPTSTTAFDPGFNGGTSIDLTNGLGALYPNGTDMLVARLSADGSQLLASTFIGGSANDGLNTNTSLKYNYADEIRGEILLDLNDNVYVASTTQSTDFPVTPGCFQPIFGGGSHDGVAFKMDASLTTMIWSTYFGGVTGDAAYAGELDDANNFYITGGTTSNNIPVTPGVVGPAFAGGAADAFVAMLRSDGGALLASTYWGTNAYDQSYFVEADNTGNIYLYGQTGASAGEMIFNAPFNQSDGGQFLTKLSPDLANAIWSSRFGNGTGTPNISPTAFLVDYCRKIYVAGWGSNIGIGPVLTTTGMDDVVTADAYQSTTDGNDFYIGVFDIDMLALYYGTYFGGPVSHEHVDGGTSRFDRRGRIYESVCAGCGGNSDFPTTPGAWSATNNSGFCNNAVFKFDFNFPIVVAGFNTTLSCYPSPIAFTNTSYGASSYSWQFGDGGGSFATNPTHVYPGPGVYTVTLIVSNAASCNVADTMIQQVVVLGNGSYSLPDTSVCAGSTVQIGVLPIPDPSITYAWSPCTSDLSDCTVANPFADPSTTTTFTLLISNGICTDTVSQVVEVSAATVDAGNDTTVCGPGPVVITLVANGFGTTDEFQWSSNALFTDQLNTTTADSTVTLGIDGDATFYVRPLGIDCGGFDSVHVHVELLDPSLSGDSLICADENAMLVLSGVDAGSSIVWAPADEIDSGQGTTTVITTPSETTAYTVDVTGPNGCTWTGGILVSVSLVNGSDVNASVDLPIVLPGTTVQLWATPSDGVTYVWSPADSVSDPFISNPTAIINVTTTFVVTVSDGICTRSDSVTVRVYEYNCGEPDIFVPNAFTPNGDGSNDTLFVRGRFISEMLFRVFDRWGEKVFETSDQSKGWDATYKDKPVDPAVFVWYLDVTCGDGQTLFLKGNTTVIR